MINTENLLSHLFDYLRRVNFPLGVDEYILAVKTIREGFCLESPDLIKQLCRVLWATSYEEQEIFDKAFSRFVDPFLRTSPELMDTKPQYTKKGPPVKERKKPPPDLASKNLIDALEFKRPSVEEIEIQPTVGDQLIEAEPEITDINTDFFFIPQLPVRNRDIEIIYRRLLSSYEFEKIQEVDIEETVKEACRTGFFLGHKLKLRRKKRLKMLLLIDKGGSMTPFSMLTETLKKGIIKGIRGESVETYYFHDCPVDIIFNHPILTGAVEIERALSKNLGTTSILIVSDAGAARGFFDKERVQKTENFISILNNFTFFYAWLNPLPASRWPGTSAEEISHLIPMFSIDRNGLNDIVTILKGHNLTSEFIRN